MHALLCKIINLMRKTSKTAIFLCIGVVMATDLSLKYQDENEKWDDSMQFLINSCFLSEKSLNHYN